MALDSILITTFFHYFKLYSTINTYNISWNRIFLYPSPNLNDVLDSVDLIFCFNISGRSFTEFVYFYVIFVHSFSAAVLVQAVLTTANFVASAKNNLFLYISFVLRTILISSVSLSLS